MAKSGRRPPSTTPFGRIASSVAEQLVADFERTREYGHLGMRGRAREESLLSRVVQAYLPRNLSVLQGAEIVGVDGSRSGECDLVIFDPRIPPLMQDDAGVQLPVESVYGVIEVKSRLTVSELRKAHAKIARVKGIEKSALAYPSSYVGCVSYDRPYVACPIHGFVIAFTSVRLDNIREAADKLHAGSEVPHRIDSVWVLTQGYVVNWSSSAKRIEPLPDDRTRLRAARAVQVLPLLISHLFGLYQEIETPPVHFDKYLGPRPEPDEWLD